MFAIALLVAKKIIIFTRKKLKKSNKRNMKKFIQLSLILALITFNACAGNNKEKTQKNNYTKEKTMGTIHLTKEEFLKKVVNYETNPNGWEYLGDKPCIIDFYADWCGPCKVIAPILEELANEYNGQIYIYKINTDEEQELSAAFGIRSIPTLLFCPLKGDPHMALGAMPKESFVKAINEILLKKQN